MFQGWSSCHGGATTVEEHGLYPALQQLTVERKITASDLTLGLLAEMTSLVFVRQKVGRSQKGVRAFRGSDFKSGTTFQ